MGQSNLALIYENYADRGALSGGSWQAGSLRLANLQTPYLAEVARSTSTAEAATQFTVDFGQPYIIGGIAFGPCNVRPDALCRYRFYDDNGLVYDSLLLPFPGSTVESANLEWEDSGFWEGTTREFDDLFKGIYLISVLSVPMSCERITVEIFDAGNPDGFIEIGRLICGKVWSPSTNYGPDGHSHDLDDLTDREEGRSGARFYNPRPMRRLFSFSFDYLPEAETFRDVYRIATRSGTHRQVVVIPNPADPDSYVREAFVGTLGTPPSLRRPSAGEAATAFKIEEVLP
ncbi:hypothetical protein R1A27_20145 [Methylobacterium sp. NMS12]|uniref:hypothetical protein n=1 Tax=Methylobacterium sp. NMS12 TaxID=3079766 RepID=UPI003F88371B